MSAWPPPSWRTMPRSSSPARRSTSTAATTSWISARPGTRTARMGLWLIPMIYVAASVACGLVVPRIEQAYFASFTFGLSVTSAQAYLSAAASGMMALTGMVFAMAFVMVQFSAIAYSPRLVLWFARDHALFH